MMSRKSFNSAFGGRWVKVDFKMDHYRPLLLYFLLWALPGLFLFIFVFSIQLTVDK